MYVPVNVGMDFIDHKPSEPQVATFPFLDLPLDIRKLVYDQLIEPFCNADGDIQMQLVRPNYELKTHPFRKRHALIFYGDTITSRQMGDPPNKDGNRHLHVDYEDYQALWSLPGVSRQIREEFASIFWPHVTLTCPLILCIPDGNFDHIEEFLQHRQQAVHTLKSFSWALILESNIEKAQQDLKSLFSVMEERAAINGMELGMCIGESVAQELLLDPDLPWIQTFRRIKKELWLDDELLPATREQLHGFLNPKVLLEKGSTAGEEYLLVREC